LSRIFEALKRAQHVWESAVDTKEGIMPPQGERRRTPRWKAHVPVFVYGHTADQQPFHEEAYSANVSDLGALLVMTATVRPGQTLLLTNKVTLQEQACRVAHVAGRDLQSVEVAVEFPGLASDFWRVTAPPRPAHAAPPEGERKRVR
jgi:hypothetical protein